VKVIKHWYKLLWNILESPSLEILKPFVVSIQSNFTLVDPALNKGLD